MSTALIPAPAAGAPFKKNVNREKYAGAFRLIREEPAYMPWSFSHTWYDPPWLSPLWPSVVIPGGQPSSLDDQHKTGYVSSVTESGGVSPPGGPVVSDDRKKTDCDVSVIGNDEAAIVNPPNANVVPSLSVEQRKTEEVMWELAMSEGHYFGQRSICELIMAKAVDPHHRCVALGNNTLLHWLCNPSPKGRVESAKALLAMGADPKAQNDAKQTPLSIAIANREQAMIDLLTPLT